MGKGKILEERWGEKNQENCGRAKEREKIGKIRKAVG